MSSIWVPDVYRQSILQEELEVEQSRLEQSEIQCRLQLSMSHTLGSSVSGDANHPHFGQLQIESGRCTLSQEQQGTQVRTSSCKAFSIRGYVANVRETDISKCWPFHQHLLQRRMGENIVILLPPLEVPAYRYWGCSECLDNEFIFDTSDKRRNDQQQPYNLTNAMPVNGDVNLPTELSKNEHSGSGNGIQNPPLRRKEVNGLEEEKKGIEDAQCMEADKRSEDVSVENFKETPHDEDRAGLHGTTKHLASHKASNDDNLCSNYEIVACNATVWPTDSEETSSAKQSLSSKDDDQILSNCTSQMKSETDTLSFREKADHNKYVHCTVNKAALYELDGDIFQKNLENITMEEVTEKLISEIPGDNTAAPSIVDDVDEEGCISKLENDAIPSIVNKHIAKTQNGKVKTLRKRSISDLIAVDANEKLKCNEANWKFKLKNMSRRAKIEMWRVSKAATYSSQKFKAPDKPNLESLDDKRKLQCQGISCQSSPSEKSVKEARRVIKTHSGSKKRGRPRKEMLAKASRKQVPAEELVQNGLEEQAVSDPEDDILNDLANFMAKNQFDRHTTPPTSRNIQETELLKVALIQNKEAEDMNCFVTEKLDTSRDPNQNHNSHSLKDELVKGTDTFSYSSAKHATVDSEVHLLVEDGVKINQVQESDKHAKQETSGQAKEAEVISDTVIGTSSSLDHHACKNTETVDRSAPSVSDKDSIGNDVMIKAHRNSGSFTFEKKSIEHLGQLFESNCNQMFIIEQSNASLDAAIHGFSAIQDKLVKGTDTFGDSSTKHATVDSEVHLLVEDGKKINQVLENGKHEKQETSGQAKKAEVNSDIVAGTSSISDHHACKNTETVDGNLKRNSSAQSVGDKNSIGNNAMIKAQRNSVSCSFEKKSIEHLGKLFNLNCDQLPIIEQSNTFLDATSFEGDDNGLNESVPSNSCKDALHSHNNGSDHFVPMGPCKDASLNTSQTAAVTTFGPAQTAAEPNLSPLYCQSRPTNPNMITVFENSETSILNATPMYQTESSPEVNKDYTAFSAGYNPMLGVLQPTIGEKNFYTNLLLSSTDGDFTFESSEEIVEQVNDQVSQKQRTCVGQPISTFPVLSGTGQQPLKILNGVPVNNVSMEYRPSNNIGFQTSYDCNLPYNIMNTPSSLGAEPTADAAKQWPLRSPVILSFAQGNKLDTQTTLSQECFDQGKFELQSYIEKRIQNYCSSKACKRTVTRKAEKGPDDEHFQTAASQENSLTKKMKAGDRQKIAVLALGTSSHCTKNKEVEQVQPDSRTAPPLVPSLSETNAMGRSMETIMKISDGQNCRKEMVAEVSHGHTDSQTPFPGGNMNTTFKNPDEQIPKRRKINQDKQAQIESQTAEPAAVALSQTNLLKQKVDSRLKITLRSGKSLDPSCLKNNMHANGPVLKRKYVKKAEKEVAETRRKLEAQSHSIQTEMCAVDNHIWPDKNPSSQDRSSAANQFAGFKHVLNPLAQNSQRRLSVPPIPFPADQQDKEAAEALKMNMTGPDMKLKTQPPMIRNSYDPRAIVNYIKWGTFSVDPPSSRALPTKVGADVPFYSKLNQNCKFVSPSKSGGVYSNINGTENNVLGSISSTSPSYAINTNIVTPSCAGNTNIGIKSHTSNGNSYISSKADNREIFTPSYAGNGNGNGNGNIANLASAGYMPGLLKPLGMSEQEALLYQIQAYLDKSNFNFSSSTNADKTLSNSMDSPP